MKILFMPSDNNLVSGAFRSMATLNYLLNNELGVETLIVLPNTTGDGFKLLDEMKLNYTYIESYNWIITQRQKLSQTFIDKCKKEEKINEKAVEELANLIVKESIDIVHINTSYSYVGALAALKTKTPIVWHLREFLEEDQKRCFIDRDRALKLISKSDRIITISKALAHKYENVFLENKLTTIYNGIDVNVFYQPDKQIFVNKDKYTFTCIGSVNPNKGQQILIEACGILHQKKKISNFVINIVGNCSDNVKELLMNIAKKYDIVDKVNLLGAHSNVVPFLLDTDIFFMCSRFEAFGRVTVEAMLSGALVIGANTGGTLEIIEDKISGLLYEQSSPSDLSTKILFALNNKDLMKKLAKNGQEIARSKLSALSNAEQIAQVYQEVLDEHRNANVYAVVVTYNRLQLLRRCLHALLKQTYKSLRIIVVNNNSTDGTTEFLDQLNNSKVIHINTGKNIGGAGGFNIGIKAAYSYNAKWVWIMDDDVVPELDALKHLLEARNSLEKTKISFLASCVYGPKGEAMNTPGVDPRAKNGYQFWYEHLDKGLVKINAATFVSILVNAEAIDKCGLPCANFFIWGDDTEYTKRLYKNFGEAYLVGKSKVLHNRTNAANLSIHTEKNIDRVKMYVYMIRNTLLYTREYAGEQAFLNKLTLYKNDCKKLRKSRDPYKKQKIRAIKKGIADYYNYDLDAFSKRHIMFYDKQAYLDEENRKVRSKPRKVTFAEKVRRGLRYCKNYGIQATIRKVIEKIKR